MAKIKRVRTKPCTRCEKINDVLYRVRIEEEGDWIFVCPVLSGKGQARQSALPIRRHVEE